MFDFRVSKPNKEETLSELFSDDILYCIYTHCGDVASQVSTYVIICKRGGLIRNDICPLHQGHFFWGGPYTIFYGEAK